MQLQQLHRLPHQPPPLGWSATPPALASAETAPVPFTRTAALGARPCGRHSCPTKYSGPLCFLSVVAPIVAIAISTAALCVHAPTATGLDASTTATTTLSGMRAAGDFHVDLLDDVEEMCQVMVSFGSVQDRLGRERERKSSQPLVQRPVRLRRRADGGVHTSPAAVTAAASTGAVRDQIQ
ncbi:hypothetical protein CFO_g1789 [Ceratocystis platani]|uniref:Uncharacterized protein n=1 Tax=Ceratocystis fimbriata f. sp. platani TaxID=88771 RepID=A0A0F8B5L1_CERFI|nr:hypothetical protein CFO_g1789 [Ceratocystis platani]